MTRTPTSRLHEWHATRELLSKMPGRLWDDMQLCDPPAPDVVLPTAGIGIEVTRVYPGGTRVKKAEGTQDAVLARACELYFAEGHPWVEVCVVWGARYPRVNRSKESLAREIAAFVITYLPEPNSEAEFRREDLPDDRFPSGIDSIALRRYEPFGAVVVTSYWHAPRGARPPVIETSSVQERLSDKESAALRWLGEPFREIWLLVLFGIGGPSSWAVLSDSLRSHVFASSATRAFLLGVGPDLVELSLALPDNELSHLPSRPA